MVDRVVFVGVDTHADVHHAAVVDELGRWLGDRGFATTPAGYAELWGWAGSFGGDRGSRVWRAPRPMVPA